jgi:hypothetical protein
MKYVFNVVAWTIAFYFLLFAFVFWLFSCSHESIFQKAFMQYEYIKTCEFKKAIGLQYFVSYSKDGKDSTAYLIQNDTYFFEDDRIVYQVKEMKKDTMKVMHLKTIH